MTTAPYDTLKSTYRKDSGRIGPYSKQFAKGATGDLFNGRTKEGKFIRKVEAELTAQVGGAPSFSQVLLIRRIARLALQAENFDNRMQNGNFTEYDGKVYGGLVQRDPANPERTWHQGGPCSDPLHLRIHDEKDQNLRS